MGMIEKVGYTVECTRKEVARWVGHKGHNCTWMKRPTGPWYRCGKRYSMRGLTLACFSWSIYWYQAIIWWYCSCWASRFWSKTVQFHLRLPPGFLDPAVWTVLDEIKVLDKPILQLVHPFPPPNLRMGDGSNHPCNTNHSMEYGGVGLKGDG